MQAAGSMRERVTILAPSESKNAFGESSIEYVETDTVWASVMGMSAREVLQSMQANAIITHKIRIRFYPSITFQHRLLWRGRTLEIASVVERDVRTVHELLAREVQ
jgi:SPP1 family predicted phage head-tail adaptor